MDKSKPIREVLGELNRRAGEGFKHAPFKMAFWVGVVVFGGLGVWLELYNLAKELLLGPGPIEPHFLRPLRIALAVFFPAITGATSLQMVFEDDSKAHRGFAVCTALLFLLLLYPISDRDISDGFGVSLGFVLSGISLWVWCAANGLSQSYRQSPDAPLGDKPLDATLSGDTDLAALKH